MIGMPAQICPRCNAQNIRGSQFCDNCRMYLADTSLTVERVTYNRRFWGSYLLESVLFIVTLVIGWFIWFWFTSKDGQTPAKKLLNLYVIKLDTGRRIGRGDAWIREVLVKALLFNGIISSLTSGISTLVDGGWIFFDKDRQALHDKMLSQIVVYAVRGLPEMMLNEGATPMLYAPGVAAAAPTAVYAQPQTPVEGQSGPGAASAATPATGSVQGLSLDLQELARLRDAGMITAAEYERRRARLIAGE